MMLELIIAVLKVCLKGIFKSQKTHAVTEVIPYQCFTSQNPGLCLKHMKITYQYIAIFLKGPIPFILVVHFTS